MLAAPTKISILLTPLLTLLLTLPLSVNAQDRIEGMMNGLNCALTGYVCPIDKRDPTAALEPDFVVHQREKEVFYMIPNIDRAVKARYFLEDVAVEGRIDDQYRIPSITADRLLVRQPDGSYQEVWSQAMQEEQRRELFGPTR